MGRFLRRKHVTEEPPEEQSFWQVPARYNFTRDVVEAYAADPLRPALTFVDRDGVIDRRTFADIAIDAGRWAGLLRLRGLEPGDRVLVVVGLDRTWHGIILGALKAGLVAIPCPASLDVAEIHRRARDAEARVAVVEADRASEIWQPDASLAVVVVEEVEPELREIPPVQPTHDSAAEDEALILYTSGTTGPPKGTILTHASTWAARVAAEHWLDARTGDLVWCTVGTSWALSIWSILFYPWSRGAESVLHDAEFDADQRFDLLQRLGVTVLCQSPTEYRLLTEAPWISRFDLGRLRHAVSSGERLELETITAFRKVFDVTIHDGYGQAENALLVANARGTAVKPGSMGLPLPGHAIAVIDEEGTELPADTEGDLALRGLPPTLFAGYVEGTAETADAFRGEWYLTGDRATRDADGYVWFTGRGAPLREVAADRARAAEAEAREAEILALENVRTDDGAENESARLDDAVGRKKKRAAADAKLLEAEAAARAERRADLERRTAEALAADEVGREEERRIAEAAERAREEAEAAQREHERREQERREQERREQERRDAEAALAEAALIEERARRQAEAEAAERARLDAEAAEAARLEAEAAQREHERRERERRDAEAALAEAALSEERARREAEAEAAERARLEAEAAQHERERREQERRDAEAALAEERARREQEEAQARAATATANAEAVAVDTADAAPPAAPALSGRAARKEQQRIRKEEERARKEEERRRKEEERARKDAERKQQEEERAAAERRKREEAEEQKAAAERAQQAEQRRKEEEKQLREEQKAAQELERREAEVRQREARAAAETQRAEEARQKAAEEERRKEDERRRKAEEKQRREAERKRKPPAPGETVAEPGDEGLDEDRPNAELIARLRAYGLRQPDDGADE